MELSSGCPDFFGVSGIFWCPEFFWFPEYFGFPELLVSGIFWVSGCVLVFMLPMCVDKLGLATRQVLG